MGKRVADSIQRQKLNYAAYRLMTRGLGWACIHLCASPVGKNKKPEKNLLFFAGCLWLLKQVVARTTRGENFTDLIPQGEQRGCVAEKAVSVILGSRGERVSLRWRPCRGSHYGIPPGPGGGAATCCWSALCAYRPRAEGSTAHRVVNSAQRGPGNCSWRKS